MSKQQAISVEIDLTYRDFVQNYLKPGRPVLLKGAFKGLPAADWTPQSLKQRFGDKYFDIDGDAVRFGDFVDAVLASTPENPAPYLRNVGVEPDFTELIPDLQPGLGYTRSNWRFLPFLPKWYFEEKAAFCQFFLAGQGRGFPFMHVDYPPMHTFSALAYGDKEWLLYGPDQAEYLYGGEGDDGWPVVSGVENPFDADLDAFPQFARASGFRVSQQPGDVIFVPCGWWHTARSHAPTITLAWDHLSSSSWKPFTQYMQGSEAFSRKGAFYRGLVGTYLALIGAALALRDNLALPFRFKEQAGRIV
jgi:histone arginine demethylase JMJD6